MRRAVRITASVVSGLVLALAASAETISVEAGKALPVRLKGEAASVVLGNKNVADVSVHDENLVFVTGKSHGTTNLMVFNRDGAEIYSADVVVTTLVSGLVTVNRSGRINTIDCTPTCRAVLNPGDDPEYFSGLIDQQESMKKLTSD